MLSGYGAGGKLPSAARCSASTLAIELDNSFVAACSGGSTHQFIHLLPSIDFDEQKRFREGTQAAEMIDYFAKHFGTKSS